MVIIETPRLALRPHRLDDFAECAAMWTDPEVTRHLSGRAAGPEEVWARILRYIGHWTALGYGYWVARERGSERYVGDVGFANWRRDIDPPFGEMPEIGWVLARSAHGQGFATEAARAALDWGKQVFGGRDTCCIIDLGNAASIRVAEKLGYRAVGETDYHGHRVLRFVRSG